MRTRRAAVLAIALASGCSTMTMRIPRSELQTDMARRFPVVADRHVVIVEASEPQIEFPGKPDVLGVRLRLRATSHSGNSQLGGTARVEGRIAYVEAEHAFYLRDPEVTALALDPPHGDGSLARLANAADARLLERASRAVIQELLRTHPVYRLDASRSKREAKAIRHLRTVHIEGDDLVLEVGL
jgi:hypothetical protein